MLIEISIGEGLDRYSILEIKQKEITDEKKKVHITNELQTLSELITYKKTFQYYYELLLSINTQIWNHTNTIKSMNPDHTAFSTISHSIFELNQSRFRLKNIINQLSESHIQEQKSYGETQIEITLTDSDPINLDMVSKLSLQYDTVIIRCSKTKQIEFEQIVPRFHYLFLHEDK
jgi:hypothetical protein